MSPRFCSQCGTKLTTGAKFCAECGAPLGSGRRAPAAAPIAGGWQLTTGGLGVFGLLLVSGLAIWAAILSPDPPKAAPGRGAAAPSLGSAGGAPGGAPAGGTGQMATAPAPPLELPAEVKSFIDDLAKKAAAAPKDKEMWLRLGKVYTRAGQLDPAYGEKALAAFQHVEEIDPGNREALRGKANVFYDRGDHAQAIPLYERYLALVGDDPGARTDLATMYLSAGDGPKAIAAYKDVIAKHPDFLQAHYNLAVTYAQLGDTDAALQAFEKTRTLAPDDKVRAQIDEMTARLKGEAPVAAAPGTAPAPPPVAAAPRSPFQADVEKRLREAPIMGERIVRVDWSAPGTARVSVQNFPMDGMPEEVRKKFAERLTLELRSAVKANPPGGDVKVEIADAGAGTVMATVTP